MSTTGKHPTFVDDILKQRAEQTRIDTPPAAIPEPAPAPKPKNKGGRPKGSGKNQKAAAAAGAAPNTPPQPPPQLTIEEELAKLKADYNKPADPTPGAAPGAAPGTTTAPAPGTVSPFLVTGHLALIVVDALIPTGMAFALNKYGWKVKRNDLKLTEEERKDIEPIMDIVVKDMIADPKILLALCLIGAYANKIPERPASDKRDAEKELRSQVEKLKAELEKMRKQ